MIIWWKPELFKKKIKKNKNTYFLNERLGSGSFSEVYKGVSDETGIEIAEKVISKVGIQKYGPDIIKAIGNEVNILQRISNKLQTPNIVRIFECFETPNNIYIILKYCNGKTIAEILEGFKDPSGERESLIIIYQIALALQVMAAEDIAHREVKPENIFINDGVYKVGDFGFASQKKLFQTTFGTYPSMAPEIFQNKDYGPKVDVLAVGVMLHEMLFGELYFIGNSHMEVATNVQNKKYVIRQPCNLSRELQDLLNKCLKKNPKQRLSATDLINHKAFDNFRNLSYFKPKRETRLKAVYFLQNLGENVGASFPRSTSGLRL